METTALASVLRHNREELTYCFERPYLSLVVSGEASAAAADAPFFVFSCINKVHESNMRGLAGHARKLLALPLEIASMTHRGTAQTLYKHIYSVISSRIMTKILWK
jgi:hypothetical protein